MVDTEDAVALAAKLAAYEAQLPQIEMLLADQPEEGSFIKMLDDMKALIEVTRKLLQAAEEEAEEPHSQSREEKTEGEEEADEKAEIKSEDIPPAAQRPSLTIGEVVEVTGSDRPYAGVITQIHDPPLDGGIEVSVKYFEYEGEVGLPWQNIARLEASEINRLSEQGDVDWWRSWKGQGKYSADQTYYRATIESLTKHGAMVTFTDYGNKEELPLAYLRPTPAKQPSSSSSLDKVRAIPEKLQIKDTDTEEQKKEKLRKSKNIRNHNRQVNKDKETAAVQKSWQKFVNKGTKRGLTGMASSFSARPGGVMAGAANRGVSSMTASSQPLKRQRFSAGPAQSGND